MKRRRAERADGWADGVKADTRAHLYLPWTIGAGRMEYMLYVRVPARGAALFAASLVSTSGALRHQLACSPFSWTSSYETSTPRHIHVPMYVRGERAWRVHRNPKHMRLVGGCALRIRTRTVWVFWTSLLPPSGVLGGRRGSRPNSWTISTDKARICVPRGRRPPPRAVPRSGDAKRFPTHFAVLSLISLKIDTWHAAGRTAERQSEVM
jgi:hypothetical protein